MPSASLAASSIESVSRWRMPSFFTSRSTNTSIVCVLPSASLGGSASSASSPSMLARTNPSWRSFASTVGERSLLLAHHRRQHREARPLGQLQHLIDHLLDGLRRDRLPAVVAVHGADARPQQAQVVVDLGRRPDRRARVARPGLLLDRDRRRQPLDRIDVGLVHLVEELAGVRRQRLDVAALALGVDRVERERRLARTRQPGDHHELVAWDVDVDVLQVVLARALDDDLFHCDGGQLAFRNELPDGLPNSRNASADRISSAFTLTPNAQMFLAARAPPDFHAAMQPPCRRRESVACGAASHRARRTPTARSCSRRARRRRWWSGRCRARPRSRPRPGRRR